MFGVLFKKMFFRAYNFIKRVSLKPYHFLETEKDDKRIWSISEYGVYSNTRSSGDHQSFFNFKCSSRKSQSQ